MYEIILWDIDGTLLRGNGIGRAATHRAMEAIYGTTGSLDMHRFGGKTDFDTLVQLLVPQGYTPDQVAARLPAFADTLAATMQALTAQYTVTPLAGALALVAAVAQRDDQWQGIVTGNTAKSAAVKLAAGGFDPAHFPFGGYGDEAIDRAELPRSALNRAAALIGRTVPPERVLIVGDTLADIDAARANAIPMCSVTTGFTDREALVAAKPDYLLDDLRDIAPIIGVTLPQEGA